MTLPRRVDVVRHPHWAGNLEATQSLLASDRDMREGPDEVGEQQAANLGFWLASVSRPDIVVASPYLRAYRGAELAVAVAWPGMTVTTDIRLVEQDKGTDGGDYYEDDNLMDRAYQGGQTLRQVGARMLDFLHDPDYADAHIVAVTHSRLMLATRIMAGRQEYLALRDQGLPNGVHGIMIGNCMVDTYARPDPDSSWFTELRVRETWGDNPLDSGPIPIA